MCQHIHKKDEVVTLFPPLCRAETHQAKRSFWAISTAIDSVTIQLYSLCSQTAVSPMRVIWDILTFTMRFNIAITNVKYVLLIFFSSQFSAMENHSIFQSVLQSINILKVYEAATVTAICSENSHLNEKLTCLHPCHSLLGRQGRSPFLLVFCLQPTGRPLSSTSRHVMRQPASIFVLPFGPAISLQTAFFLEVIWITSIPCREAGSYKKLYPRESELLSPAAEGRLLSLIHQPIHRCCGYIAERQDTS